MRQLLVLCLICFGILFSVNASTVDKDNQKGYEYKRVLDIIARENLIVDVYRNRFLASHNVQMECKLNM